MQKEILDYLSSDATIVRLLDHRFPELTKISISKPIHPDKYPYLVYNITPYSISIPLKEYRLSLHICTKTHKENEDIQERLLDLLDLSGKPGFQIKNKTIYHSRLVSGGSFLFHRNENVYEQTMFFHIKTN
ncbi:hypothetical protein [Bacillus weihaiensis]|uniref:hypothetical protein n=1 Tax=Bacillus weihaiensis TaxID=1547283 RepID=UPI002353FCB2|nr:hypothetical protein [Bacillus weihaiensis]